MATTRLGSVEHTGVWAVIRELFTRDPRLFVVTAGNTVLFVAFVLGVALDPAAVPATTGTDTEPRWLKPAKFAGSITLFTGTLGWLGVHLPVGDRFRRRVSWTVALGGVVEIVLIAGQAARGVESHFNMSTFIDGAVYATMGVAILAVTVAVGWTAIRTAREGFETPSAFTTGIQLGLVVFVVGALEGGVVTFSTVNGEGSEIPQAAGLRPATAELVGRLPF